MAEGDNDLEIGDVEQYGNQKDSGFSHQVLVMKTMSKALENAGKEMKAGWFETKYDKQGNLLRTYNEDTRLAFISSVDAVLIAVEADIDRDENYITKEKHIARKEIEKLFLQLENKKQDLIKAEENEWNMMIPYIKQKLNENGKGFIKGYLNREKRFYQLFIEEEVKIYKEILKSVSRLIQRLDNFAEEMLVMNG